MKLSTHVLDLTTGRPAAGMRIELLTGTGTTLRDVVTNSDGRTDHPLLSDDELIPAEYELRFHVGSYFGDPDGFLGVVPVRFRITNQTSNHHVPLLCTPWAYSTYRGS